MVVCINSAVHIQNNCLKEGLPEPPDAVRDWKGNSVGWCSQFCGLFPEDTAQSTRHRVTRTPAEGSPFSLWCLRTETKAARATEKRGGKSQKRWIQQGGKPSNLLVNSLRVFSWLANCEWMRRGDTTGPTRKQQLEGWQHWVESSPAMWEGLVNTWASIGTSEDRA